jgi:hypothetical protein
MSGDLPNTPSVGTFSIKDIERLLEQLPHPFAVPDTAIVMHPANYLQVRLIELSIVYRAARRRRTIRTLYGYRMAYAQERVTSKKASCLAIIDRNEAIETARRAGKDQSDVDREVINEVLRGHLDIPYAMLPRRRPKDKYMGKPDMFWCCGGRGFHQTKMGELYCPCQAGQLRESLDGGVS